MSKKYGILLQTFGNLNEIALGGKFGEVHQTMLEGVLTTIAVTLLMFIYSLFILRKVKPVNQCSEERFPCPAQLSAEEKA